MVGVGRFERVLLVCGAIGAVLFVVLFVVDGALRVDYSPLRHPVSALSIGESGWMQAANFIVTGLLFLACAVGLRPALRRLGGGPWVPVLIGLVGVGLIGAGFFATDPISGYPLGTPPVSPVRTTHGVLHDLFSTPVFTALPAASCVVGYRLARTGHRAWAAYSIGTAVVFLIGFVLAGVGFAQNPVLMPVGGLLQRLTLVVGFGWLAALAISLPRFPERPDPVAGPRA
ncbi:DUF998 domain-containing protein [Saccharopolyspora spinosa]|uniref:Uncharacterized protein DUF998 n=1 Tax=Saccharopolyspora spinosa TaxID=60894 RepID=A0A2N3Y4I7_SACSN|nr:DUF998 domain-containing protein [Saccharopolyspora spinosa]PKW17817.1 uncharacterized protein DUF998 [Saccharopolyspora spinosa]